MGKAEGASKLSAKDLYGESYLQTYPKFPMAKAPLESWMWMLGSFRLELDQSHTNPEFPTQQAGLTWQQKHTSHLC